MAIPKTNELAPVGTLKCIQKPKTVYL